ncbi:MAG: manganese efflux pump MntP family protein [Spirochaetes bacterium]|nr:manganese efflux pump MntP family protein [Spirochaetota bacterium]
MTGLLLIAFSLSIDAFAVSLCSAGNVRERRFFYAFRASFCFGFFQAAMPLLGWLLGGVFVERVGVFSHWVAFAILAFLGAKMIFEALRDGKDSCNVKAADIRSVRVLLALAFATSIDALAAGVSLNIMGAGVALSAALIGAVTFFVCLCAFELGRRASALLQLPASIAGGLILIGIGISMLF